MKILILGASGFIGKELLKKIKNNSNYIISTAGRTAISDINFFLIDRKNTVPTIDEEFDAVIDLSCYEFIFLKNTLPALKFKKYIFLSSMAVTHIFNLNNYYKNNESRDIFKYSKEKLLCEEYIICNIDNYTIIRPGYVINEGSESDRFELKDNSYYWKDSNTKVINYITMNNLINVIEESFFSNPRSIIPCIM